MQVIVSMLQLLHFTIFDMVDCWSSCNWWYAKFTWPYYVPYYLYIKIIVLLHRQYIHCKKNAIVDIICFNHMHHRDLQSAYTCPKLAGKVNPCHLLEAQFVSVSDLLPIHSSLADSWIDWCLSHWPRIGSWIKKTNDIESNPSQCMTRYLHCQRHLFASDSCQTCS